MLDGERLNHNGSSGIRSSEVPVSLAIPLPYLALAAAQEVVPAEVVTGESDARLDCSCQAALIERQAGYDTNAVTLPS
jgi:hypothetical protein